MEAIENVNYDAPVELKTTQPGSTNLMPNVLGLPQKQRVYKVKRVESGFKLLLRPEQKNTVWLKTYYRRLRSQKFW